MGAETDEREEQKAMMDALGTEQVADLISRSEPPLISIYMPTHRRGAEVQQDPIRLKNLIEKAVDRLEELGTRSAEARRMLDPVGRLIDQYEFWQHQEDGLAAFADRSGAETYRLPRSFEELVVVGERFHIKPLLPVVAGGDEFYLLAVSHNRVRLLRGNRHTVSELALTDVPLSLAEALWFRDPERELQHHATSQGAGAGTAAVFHGHGMGGESSDEDLLTFFRAVDEGVRQVVDDPSTPVVLAGVEYLHPLYRKASRLNLADKGVVGNPDEVSAGDLHRQAWPVVEELLARSRKAAEEVYFSGTSPTASDVAETVRCAAQARVATLFVPEKAHHWGTFDPETHQVSLQGGEGAVDLYDLAAAATWRAGGEVFVVGDGEIPGSGELAAVLRY